MLIELLELEKSRTSYEHMHSRILYGVSISSCMCKLRSTYNCNLATELVLDLTRFDSIRRMLLNELVQMLDTHSGELSA